MPTETTNMLYKKCADLTEKKIQTFYNRFLTDRKKDLYKKFREKWGPWQKYQRKKDIKAFNHLALPKTKEQFEKKDIFCPILQERLSDKNANFTPISYKNRTYSLKCFKKNYIETGKEPNTREKIDLKEVKLVSIKET